MNLPPHIQNLPAYIPGETLPALAARLGLPPESIIKLDANENPFGTPPAVRRALAALDNPHLYPDPEYRELREALAGYTGVPAEWLIPGNGSDELLSLITQVMLQPGDSVIVCPPTFSMYAFYARLKNCHVIEVPRKDDFSLDVEGIVSAARASSAKMIFIDAPGNPTGLGLPAGCFDALSALPALTVLDEAYIEFSDSRSHITDVPGQENLAVIRTFSKWAGLAGFRIGYGAFPKWLGSALWTAKSPYNVTVPAVTAAVAALSEVDFLLETVAALRVQRERLADELSHFTGLAVFPSETNFLLVRVTPEFGLSAVELYEGLKERGILVRLFAGLEAIRITVGKPEHTDALLKAIGMVSSKW